MMRKFLIPLAAAASTVAIAAPASAQYYPQPQHQPGYGYGQHQNFGHARALTARINHIQRQIQRLAQYRMITRSEYNRLIRDSREIERRFYRNARDGRGLTQREMYDVERRIGRLEQRIARDVRDGRQWRYRW